MASTLPAIGSSLSSALHAAAADLRGAATAVEQGRLIRPVQPMMPGGGAGAEYAQAEAAAGGDEVLINPIAQALQNATQGDGNVVDAAVQLLAARTQLRANVAVLRTTDRLVGQLVDIVA